jgi:hypothetical protein
MNSDMLIFALNVEEVSFFKAHPEILTSFDLTGLCQELWIGQFFILEALPKHRYLHIKKANAIGFTIHLNRCLSEAKKLGVARLSGMYQELYDLEIRKQGDRLSIADLLHPDHPTLEVNMARFRKSVHDCGAIIYQTLLWLFPELVSHPDIDRVYKLLCEGRQ